MAALSQFELALKKQLILDRSRDPVPARIVLRAAGKTPDGRTKIIIMGCIIGDLGLVDPNVDEMWITDVILVPDRRFRDTKKRFLGLSADQILTDSYSDESCYGEEVDLSGKPVKKSKPEKKKKKSKR